MANDRLAKLVELLSSKNKILRGEAIASISQFPFENAELLITLHSQLQNLSWDVRIATSDAIEAVLSTTLAKMSADNTEKTCTLGNINAKTGELSLANFHNLKELNLLSIMTKYKPLLSDNAVEQHTPTKVISKKEQRKLIDLQLDLYESGLSSRGFILDEEMSLDKSSSSSESESKEELKCDIIKNDHSPLLAAPKDVKIYKFETILEKFLHVLFADLVDPVWQKRHGAALALNKIVLCCTPSQLLCHMETIAIRLLQLLCLDRFNDFVTGSNTVAPVRETAAQALSLLMLKSETISSNLVIIIFQHLKNLLNMKALEQWQCRFTSLLVLRYYLSMSANTNEFMNLLQEVINSILDNDDEVASRSIIALSAFFTNPKIDGLVKAPLIKQTMDVIWTMLLNNDHLSELVDDVNSLLVDLLNIVHTWLKIEINSYLNNDQLQTIIKLFDAHSVTRTIQAIKCVNFALKKSLILLIPKENFCLNDENVYALLKSMYRCILFASCSNSSANEKLFDAIFETIGSIISAVENKKMSEIDIVRASIGPWLACLNYSYRQLEIDVFLHVVDGHSSIREAPTEMLCGEEIRSFTEEQINEMLLSRKVVAARFLGKILNAIYQSGITIGDLPSHICVQNMFPPYLQSNSLYHRMGVALVINSLAHSYHKATLIEDVVLLKKPEILLAELQNQIFTTTPKSYIEVEASINALTKEINDFQQYCAKKGVPREDLPSVDQATTMEQVALAAYSSLKKRLTRQGDLDSLEVCYNVVLDFIRSAKISFRVNTTRVDTLLISSLLLYGYSPETLTPVIKPLIDATNFEENLLLMEEMFFDSFAILIQLALKRPNNSLLKILKCLLTGLCSCNNFAPKLSDWSDEDKSLTMISLINDSAEVEVGLKSKNTRRIIENICDYFGPFFFNEIQEFKHFFSLETNDLEDFLMNLEMFSVVHTRLAPISFKLPIFSCIYNVDKDDTKSTLLETFVIHLSNKNPAVRFRIAKFLVNFASVNLSAMLNFFYNKIAGLMTNFGCDTGRCGAIELLLLLSKKEHQVLGAISLLAPLAFKAISDPLESVRTCAAISFGKFISLLSLENPKKYPLTELSLKLRDTYEANQNFFDVLSCPHNLPRIQSTEIPNLISTVSLRSYQLEGITWMRYLSKFGLNGILADDMGLGKTLQVLCVLALEKEILKKENLSKSNDLAKTPLGSLIICPKTLVNHWLNEWRLFFKSEVPFLKIENDKEFTKEFLQRYLKDNWNEDLVLVMSYEEVRNFKCLSEFRWNFVILDEGHCIRNPSSHIFKSITSLISKHKLILSGTPVQNSPADLWALFSYLMPGYLSTKAYFNANYMKKIMACRNLKATEHQTEEGQKVLQKLHSRVLPFILRRMKSDVLKELPEKVIQDYVCQLTDFQKSIYTFIVDNCISTIAKEKLDKNLDSVDGQSKTFSPLHTLILLRKLVDHPVLVAKDVEFFFKNDADQKTLYSQSIELSGKMVALKELLEECQIGNCHNNNLELLDEESSVDNNSSQIEELLTRTSMSRQRALIFCQWKASIDLIANYIDSAVFGEGILYLRLDGTVPANDRQMVVDRFNKDTSIDLLLLSTHIGGVGLTLTGANVVIFVDHDWNPVKDLQAIDRTHRLGQTRTVNVYRLITQSSIEEKVMRLQKFKSNTADVLVGTDNSSISSMATSDLKELFSLSENTPFKCEEESGPIKKPRKSELLIELGADNKIGEKWSLETLWDNSTYEEEHSIETFMDKAKNVI